jgi:hypothetical protein
MGTRQEDFQHHRGQGRERGAPAGKKNGDFYTWLKLIAKLAFDFWVENTYSVNEFFPRYINCFVEDYYVET